MVARSPPYKQRKMVAVAPPISPTLLRDTVNKVDKCMARLQELQYTVTGGKKAISGVTLSPQSSRNYLRASLRCKHESSRLKTGSSRRSPPGKLPVHTEEWRKMSLPAMLLGETMGEIVQASQFAKNIVQAVSSKPASDDPKTPLTERRQKRPTPENSELPARRRREKQVALQNTRSSPPLQRAKSRINFKISPPKNRESDKENCRYIANRVSPRNKPWVKKTVLFPNPLFHSSPTSHHQKFSKTKSPMISRSRVSPPKILIKSPPTKSIANSRNRHNTLNKSPMISRSRVSPPKILIKSSPTKSPLTSRNRNTPHKFLIKTPNAPPKILIKSSPTKSPVISRNRQTPHKFLIKSPNAPKLQVKIKSPPLCISPTQAASLIKKSPKQAASSFSRLRRSFSPSRLAHRLASPLKSRKSVQKTEGMMKIPSGVVKQRPTSFSIRFSPRRI